MIRYTRELELTIEWKMNAKCDLTSVENPSYEKINLDGGNNQN